MAKGQEIVLTSNPRGNYLEGIIGDASLPGTIMQIKAGVDAVNGRHTWVALGNHSGNTYNPGAATDPRLTAILLPDRLQGFTQSTAYVSGQRCFLYCPIPGDELNVLCAAQQGTGSADAYFVGERLVPSVSSGSNGQLVVQSTSGSRAPFVSAEHINLTADVAGLVWCYYAG